MTKPYNPSAFPTVLPKDWDSVNEGMTLRDYFAGQALVGVLAGRQPNNDYPLEHVVETSYAFADAMLERSTSTRED
jgi:hypothetical protein